MIIPLHLIHVLIGREKCHRLEHWIVIAYILFNGFETVVYVWSVLAKSCWNVCLGLGISHILEILKKAKVPFLISVWAHLLRPTPDWFSSGSCWPTQSAGKPQPCFLQACLTFVLLEQQEHTVRSMHCPLPRLVSHRLSSGGSYLLEMANRKNLISSDIQYVFYLCTTLTYLSRSHINKYTAPAALIIGASAQTHVLCCCQKMENYFFFSNLVL